MSKYIRIYRGSNNSFILLDYINKCKSLFIQQSVVVPIGENEKLELLKDCCRPVEALSCIGCVTARKDGKFVDQLLMFVTSSRKIGKLLDNDVNRIDDVIYISIYNHSNPPTYLNEIKRLFTSGCFYFTTMTSASDDDVTQLHLTRTLQKQQNPSNDFCWNRQLLTYFTSCGLDAYQWCDDVMCGGVSIKTVYIGSQQGRVAVISRLSCNRVGTRFTTRGSDYDGHVANFVESEQIIAVKDKVSSFLQIRGSVPLLWEQPGLNVGSHKIKLSFDAEISSHVYQRHLDQLLSNYGKVAIVNLLGSKEGEASLTKAFQNHHENWNVQNEVDFISFDFHYQIRNKKPPNFKQIDDLLSSHLHDFGIFSYHDNQTTHQNGVLRINCLDCLDRTNSLQTHIAIQKLADQLISLGFNENETLRLKELFKKIWSEVGDCISRMYAGTGALEGKDDKVGRIRDGAKSVTRALQNNFFDQNKQDAICRLLQNQFDVLMTSQNSDSGDDDVNITDLLFQSRDILSTSQYLNSSSQILKELCRRNQQFIEQRRIVVAMGTWNVNGGKHVTSVAQKDQTLNNWLFPFEDNKFCVAKFDFTSDEDGDLPLALDDVICIEEEMDEWIRGRKLFGDQNSGIFPKNYVTLLSNPVRAIHDFDAIEADDLQLSVDDVIEVVSTDGDWFHGSICRNGDVIEGNFPANYVVPMTSSPDIFALGFEEMVELNAGNIVNTSSSNQLKWGGELLKAINHEKRSLRSQQDYIQLASIQLVGVCLFVFIKSSFASKIKKLSCARTKTGLGGTTGNKGGVGISLVINNSSFCFVTSHLAAGQSQVQERNSDFNDISNHLVFADGRKLHQHDYIFWCGDFNYRIDLGNEETKKLILQQEWSSLLERDQLKQQMLLGNCFHGYHEADIRFAPTYKYDLFSDDYDTSEKNRVPSYTDRVLWKKSPWLPVVTSSQADDEVICYTRAELKTSDHRPVMAVFEVDMNVVISDEERSRVYDVVQSESKHLHLLFIYIKNYDVITCDVSTFHRFLSHHDIGRPISAKLFRLDVCDVINTIFCRWFRHGMLLAFDDVIESRNLLKLDESYFEEKIFRIEHYSNELTSDWTIPDDVKTSVMTSQVEPEVPRRPPLPLATNKSSRPSLPPPLPSNLKPGPPERPPKIQIPSEGFLTPHQSQVPQPPQQVTSQQSQVPQSPQQVPQPPQQVPQPPQQVLQPPQQVLQPPQQVPQPPQNSLQSVQLENFFANFEIPKNFGISEKVETKKKRPAPRPPKSTPQAPKPTPRPLRSAPKPPSLAQRLLNPPETLKPAPNHRIHIDDVFSCNNTTMPPPLLPSRNDDVTMPPPLLPSRNDDVMMPSPLFPSRNDDVTMPPPLLPSRNDDVTMPPPLLPSRNDDVTMPPPLLPSRNDDVTMPPPLLPSRNDDVTMPPPLFPSHNDDMTRSSPWLPSRNDDVTMPPPLFPSRNDDVTTEDDFFAQILSSSNMQK